MEYKFVEGTAYPHQLLFVNGSNRNRELDDWLATNLEFNDWNWPLEAAPYGMELLCFRTKRAAAFFKISWNESPPLAPDSTSSAFYCPYVPLTMVTVSKTTQEILQEMLEEVDAKSPVIKVYEDDGSSSSAPVLVGYKGRIS